MHKVPTRRLLPRKFHMVPSYIKEAIAERGKCYLSALFFLWREKERAKCKLCAGLGDQTTREGHSDYYN